MIIANSIPGICHNITFIGNQVILTMIDSVSHGDFSFHFTGALLRKIRSVKTMNIIVIDVHPTNETEIILHMTHRRSDKYHIPLKRIVRDDVYLTAITCVGDSFEDMAIDIFLENCFAKGVDEVWIYSPYDMAIDDQRVVHIRSNMPFDNAQTDGLWINYHRSKYVMPLCPTDIIKSIPVKPFDLEVVLIDDRVAFHPCQAEEVLKRINKH